eukprot:CAMPEP_0197694946 /NCGR_PEP_ID=MMETSP1338-20131121/114544_1 /TAXON_ID=43686 ORGANISM="Pelagodinium beii, Strain RCC1491" /NCGR_SAMPLE_ID=MMETSP1338 /ASSEMBLY_ACC=CAM_ASM_000754 /LENGTH=198 /DNA_ID=CAMNT_0043277863 /DNA_START=1 /DNA_END=593 /DNA_ORIENTATION=-
MASCVPPEAALTSAVVWLYSEAAEPKVKLVQWLGHRRFGLNLNVSDLRNLVETIPGVYLEPSTPNRQFLILLEDPPPNSHFSDGSGICMLPKAMDEVSRLLGEGGWPLSTRAEHQAFEIASWLRSSPQLCDLSFGQMLDFVQNARQRNLLGTSRDRLVQYQHSDEMRRMCNIKELRPTGVRPGEFYVSSWPVLRGCLT